MKLIDRCLSQCYNWYIQRKIDSLEKEHYATVTFPEETEEGLDSLIGMVSEKEAFKDALNFFKGIEIYSKSESLKPNTRFLIGGEPGSGKSPLIKAIAKEADVPLITCKIARWPISSQAKLITIIKNVFDIVNCFANGCMVTFEHFNALPSYEVEKGDKIHTFLASKIQESENAVIILETVTGTIALPPFYLEHNMFNVNRVITVMPPTLESRKELFKRYLQKYGIELDDELNDRLAKNTMGCYPKDIEYIVEETLLRITRNGLSEVEFKDFHETILLMDSGQENHAKMTEKDRISTAYHEAGHIIAAYYSNPNYVLGRVEITPRAQSLGLTLEEIGDEKYAYFKKDYENEIIYSLGGMAAEKYVYGETTSGVSGDLTSANWCANLMVKSAGMSDELGPIIFDDEYGCVSESFYEKAEAIVQDILKKLYEKTYTIVSTHGKQLEALANALLENEVLVGDEIKKVLDEVDSKVEKNTND